MRFLILFLTLSSFGFYSAKGTPAAKVVDLDGRSVLGVEYNSLLYKASITFRDYRFSGLVLIKKQQHDSATHVVFMSEFGLTMLDVKYKNDAFELVSAKEFFNNPRLLGVIYDDFRIVLQDLEYVKKPKEKETCGGGNKLKFRHVSGVFVYFYQPRFSVGKAIWRKNMLRVVKVFIDRADEDLPRKLRFTHRGVSLEVNMELINYKKGNGN